MTHPQILEAERTGDVFDFYKNNENIWKDECVRCSVDIVENSGVQYYEFDDCLVCENCKDEYVSNKKRKA